MEPEAFTSDSSSLGESGLAAAAATLLSAGSGLATARYPIFLRNSGTQTTTYDLSATGEQIPNPNFFLNGQRVTAVTLQPGQVLDAGRLALGGLAAQSAIEGCQRPGGVQLAPRPLVQGEAADRGGEGPPEEAARGDRGLPRGDG